jgi:NADPH-dependent 2,4-dienoyl-CoA reductase/sulfur reductase-like enzyme
VALDRVVVVGASLAGLRAVETLRKSGFEGSVTLVGEEAHLPYDRPPLSKEVLKGERSIGTVGFRDEAFFEGLGVEVRTGQRATGLDLNDRHLLLGDERLPFDGAILATGSSPRTLPSMPALRGVYTLRTLDDTHALLDAFARNPRVAVVGAGFIGSEVASSARSRGLEVTVIEALPVPLVRAIGEAMGAVCASLHRDRGTDLRCGAGVDAVEGSGRVERIRLTDGSTVAADVVIVGVGVSPTTEWLEGSGLEIRNGLVCDATLCAGPPFVFGAGDIVRWPNPLFDMEMRLEHWTNATEQGAFAARNLLSGGGAKPFESVPYFWSDQYGIRIQLVGYAEGDEDEVLVCHGSVEERQFVALYRRGDRLVAAFSMNWPALVMQYRTKIMQGATWDQALEFAAAQR